MEERMVDDEYGRGVRLKKTSDGYVDVTDELATDDEGEEIAFAFPLSDTDEDDEDLVGLSPEEAAALREKKAADAAKRQAEYEQACKDAEVLLQAQDFAAAEKAYEQALQLDTVATEASVGYWRAKTENMTKPEVLMDEYVDAGIENLEYDLGYEATERLRKEYQGVFRRRHAELSAEEKPLAESVLQAQSRRRSILSARLKRSALAFAIGAVCAALLLVGTIVLASQIFSTRDNVHLLPTIVCGVVFLVALIFLIVATNRFLNDLRMRAKNERLSSTDDGARLERLREYKELYACFLLDEVGEEENE